MRGSWVAKRDGSGKTRIVSNAPISNALQLDPKQSTDASQTHSALVISSANFDDIDATIDLQTVKQLRSGSSPYPCETGWILWHYTDDNHFYYFAPKTNGWELGKEDPSAPTARRYLATGTSPAFPVGTLQKIRIVQNGNAITVYDNGLKIVSVTDAKSPYTSGRFGLYCEDSEADFGSLKLTTSAGTTTI
ncbi:MAG: family 16 glycoside hydrolase [Vulcanimicrobiaceae bacterium]